MTLDTNTVKKDFEERLKRAFIRIGNDGAHYYTMMFGLTGEYEIRIMPLKDDKYSVGIYKNDAPETIDVLVDMKEKA